MNASTFQSKMLHVLVGVLWAYSFKAVAVSEFCTCIHSFAYDHLFMDYENVLTLFFYMQYVQDSFKMHVFSSSFV